MADGMFSAPVEQGKLAVVHSLGVTQDSDYTADQQKAIFKAEAEVVAEHRFASQYKTTEVYPVATSYDMNLILEDDEVAGMILIGHGTIAALRLVDDNYYNWRNAERATRELKLGHFIQRTCGHFAVPQSVPLGTYVAADRRKLIAPVGIKIDDKHPDESVFTQVYDTEQVTADDVLALRDNYHRSKIT